MQEQTGQGYQAIKRFTNELLDKRYCDMKKLREAQKACRTYIETKLSKDSEIKKFLPSHYEQSSLMKELIVDYALMKMTHHAALWEKDNHTLGGERLSLTKAEQELFAKFDEHCNNAFERMKKDKILIEIALRKLEGDYKDIFNSTLHKFVSEDFKYDYSLQNFYNTHHDLCMKKVDEYRYRFSQFAEGK